MEKMCKIDKAEEMTENDWIPCSERLPKPGEYVLVSFENDRILLPHIATYEVNREGTEFLPK